MGRIVDRVQALALALGAPGLFLVAVLDSSILSLPEIADLLVIWMVVQHKSALVLYAASATLGSVAGCLALVLHRPQGRRRAGPQAVQVHHVDRTLAAFQRYGVMAVLIPSILPPPAPFKIFVLLAGVAEIRRCRFAVGHRHRPGREYFAEGLLALWYGEQAIDFMRENGRVVALASSSS